LITDTDLINISEIIINNYIKKGTNNLEFYSSYWFLLFEIKYI